MNAQSPETTLPFDPPFCTSALPAVGGAIGPEPEHFRVDEIPAYAASGEGEHCYVRIEKRLLTTPEAVKLIAEVAGVDARDIGYAGLKDKHAVTTQWLSLPKKSVPAEQWKLPDRLRVLESSFHANKLRTGHLTGNRFRSHSRESTLPPASARGPSPSTSRSSACRTTSARSVSAAAETTWRKPWAGSATAGGSASAASCSSSIRASSSPRCSTAT